MARRHQYRVEGPVMIFLTATAIDLDEELLNRCLVLTVNEERAQTQGIHRMQREAQTIEGGWNGRTGGSYSRCIRMRNGCCGRCLLPIRMRAIAVSGQSDARAAGPHEVPDADPLDCTLASAAAGSKRDASREDD